MPKHKVMLSTTKVGNANVVELRDNATKNVLYMEPVFPETYVCSAYFRFDENTGTSTLDHIGGSIGTLSNANIWTTGKNNSGARFTTGQTISVPNSANFSVSETGAFSLSVWVYTEDLIYNTGNVNNYILTHAGAYRNFALVRGAAGYQFTMNTTGGVALIGVNTDGSWGINAWHHIVAVYDPAIGSKIYMNGVLSDTDASTGTIYQTGSALSIGHATNDNFRFVGKVDELAFWQCALTAEDALALYNNGLGNFN